MKLKIIIGYLIALTFVSCREPNVKEIQTDCYLSNDGIPLRVVVVDSCEYLYKEVHARIYFTHKGNCAHCRAIKN